MDAMGDARSTPDPEAASGAAEPLLRAHAGGREALAVDEVLRRHAGELGPWQLRHFLLTSAAWALEAFHTMVTIFADHQPPWRCIASAEACGRLDLCALQPGEWAWVGRPGESTVSEWGLVCGDRYKVGLVQAAFFAGCMLGAGVFGHLSDSFLGRKGCLTVVCALNLTFGLLTAVAPSFSVYLVLRILTGFSTGGVGLCAFVLATEPIGPSKRGTAGMSTLYFFASGTAVLSLASSAVTSWRLLYVLTSLPSLLYLAVFLPFIAESPRWLLVRGEPHRAMQLLDSIAKRNGREPIPPHVSLSLDVDGKQSTLPNPDGYSILDVVRSPATRARLFLIVAINMLCSVIYYGLSLNVANLKTDVHLSVFLNAVAELPAFALTAVLLEKTGRRTMAVATMSVSGAFCLLGTALPAAARLGCGLLGIFGMAATYNLLFVYVAELFPTVVRNVALGCATQAGQMGAIVAPLVVVLGSRWPLLVFGVSGLLGGLLSFYLPETMNKPFYDTLQGMEEEEEKTTMVATNSNAGLVNCC